jgi:AraC-like DNA-binding protein
MRVERAKGLLADTGLLIKEVAGEVGFRNVETFIRAFRSVCGMTPGQYRRDAKTASGSPGGGGRIGAWRGL